MQKYVDALAQRNENDARKAEDACKNARAKLKDHQKSASAVVAGILALSVADVSASSERYDRYTIVKGWQGVRLNVSENKEWKKYEAKSNELSVALSNCCNEEVAIKVRGNVETINRFRKFMSARYGKTPTVTTAAAVQAFIDSLSPVACKTH